MKKIIFLILFVFLYSQNIFSKGKLDLNFQQIRLSEALTIYSDYTNTNMIIDSSIDDIIDIRLHDVRPEQLLNVLMNMYDLVLTDESGISTVMKRSEYESRYQSRNLYIYQVKYIKAANLIKTLDKTVRTTGVKNNKKALKESITLHTDTNSIVLQGTRHFINHYKSILHKLDKPQKQLILEAKLVSIGDQDLLNLGFKLNNTVLADDSVFTQAIDLGVQSTSAYGFLIRKAGKFALDIELMAMETNGTIEVTSTPTIFTHNNKQGSITQGVEIPYTVQDENFARHVEFKNALTELRITPRISGDDIFLDVFVSKDTVGQVTEEGQPTIDTRQITSYVKLKDGETIILGGIKDIESSVSYSKVPYLSDIPYLGSWLFTSIQKNNTKKNLVVFITPTILNTYNDKVLINNNK